MNIVWGGRRVECTGEHCGKVEGVGGEFQVKIVLGGGG